MPRAVALIYRMMHALQPDPAGPSELETVAPSGCKPWVDICFEHLCLQGLVDFVCLIRWCRVSREWMDALKRALRLMQQVSFPEGVTGEDALRALGLVAGGNVRFLRLRQCRNLIPGDIEEILHRLQATCLAVMEVDVTGCRDDVILRALSVRTISMVGGSPFDVPAQLKGLAPGSAHCPLRAFLNALEPLSPRLVFGQEFAPDDEEFLKLAAKACIACNATSVAELALLLCLAFPGRNPGDTRVFDCNKRGPRGDTALMLACRAGLLVLATMLMDAGAHVSVANEQGETPLLASLTSNLELAELLVRRGANVKAQRRDGAGLIALAIHSKCPDSISFALRHGPERISEVDQVLALLSPDIPVCFQQHLPAVRLRTTTAPPALRLPDCTPCRSGAHERRRALSMPWRRRTRLRATSSYGFSLVRPLGLLLSRSGPCYCIPRWMLAGSMTCAPCSTGTRNFYRTRQNGRRPERGGAACLTRSRRICAAGCD